MTMDANAAKQAGVNLDAEDSEEVLVPGKIRQVSSFLDSALEQARGRCTGAERPVPMPWPKLAEAYGGGWWPGLHMIVGKPKSGKSQFTLQAAFHAAQAGVPVLYVGLELGELDIVSRLAVLDDEVRKYRNGRGIAWSEIFLGKLTEDELAAVSVQAGKTLATMPLYLEVGGPHGWPFTRLAEAAEELRTLHPKGPAMLVLDFLQIVGTPPGDSRMDTRERIMRASYAGRAVARDMGMAVVFVSSTAREYYKQLDEAGNKPGSLSSQGEQVNLELGDPSALMGTGKESGEVEYSCDTITVLCPGEREAGRPTVTRVALAGGRAVVPAWRELRFDGTCFAESQKVSS